MTLVADGDGGGLEGVPGIGSQPRPHAEAAHTNCSQLANLYARMVQ